MKRLEDWYWSLSLFWQVYLFIVVVLVGIVTVSEFLVEPIMEWHFLGILDLSIDWYEIPVWIISILVPSLACGYILSSALTIKLQNMASTADAFAHGNTGARMETRGNPANPFDELAASFNIMADSIERQLAHERRLIVDIGHELRSPLARMAIAGELIERETSPAGKATLARLEKDIRYVSDLLAAMLAQGRERNIDMGEEENIEIRQSLTELVDDYLFQRGSQGKRVETRCDQRMETRGNKLIFRRIVGNVLNNAMFYSPPGGLVEASARAEAGYARIVVRDHGPGVPEHMLEDIFRPFYRVDDARVRTNGGAGLGLALARAEATRLGGRIIAENAHPGLRVSIFFPLAPSAA